MAGVTTQTLAAGLGADKIVRAMPNLPAQIGMGMTAFTATAAVTRLELSMVQNLLATTGKTLYVDEESRLDAVTAISGSGPAYVFYFMEAMMQAARGMGFSPSEAELLVAQTFQGTSELYGKTEAGCTEWIARVASKGGTTEAALRSFGTDSLSTQIEKGLTAALHRAQELGQMKN
jgi:pyrroline-5-carboxylate reductase